MLKRSYHASIASLLSSSLMFGLVFGCGASNDMPTSGGGYSDRAIARSAPSYDESAATPAPSRPSTSSTSTPLASGPTYSSSTPEHDSRDIAGSDISLTDPAPGTRNEHRKDVFVPRSGMQSGLLTAGSFDDVTNYHEYVQLLRSNPYVVSNCRLPITADMRQTVLQVTDGQGRPISNARCIVTSPHDEQNVLSNLCTGSDGRTTLLTQNGNHNLQQQSLRLQVFLQDCDTAVIDELRTPQDRWDIVLQEGQSTLPTQLDLALVIDTTGSMGDELDYLKAEIDGIVASVHRMFPNVDQRFSLITYRDQGDEYVCRSFDFTESLSDFRRNLDAQTAGGGGDFPEAMDTALHSALQLNWRNSNTARVMFLVGDAPPHTERAASAVTALNNLRQKGVRIFPVGASGVEKSAEILMRTASVLTMGQYLFLTDHSGVGNAHATPSVSSFAVEKLDRLMIRMIASELAGKRLIPQEVIAIERGEPYSWAPPIPCPQTSYEPYSKPIGYSTQFFVPEPSLLEQLAHWIRRHTMTMAIAVLTFAMVVVENRQHGRCREQG